MASPDVTLPRPDLPLAPWVLAPGETAISRVPRYLAKSGKVQIRQVQALTVALPDKYPFAPELALDRNGNKRYRISWFVITAPSGVRLTALLAGVGNVWIERTQDGGRVWICDWPGHWTEWQGTRVRHPILPGMQFYFAGREWRWDDGDRIVKHQLSAWKRGLKPVPEAVLVILWGAGWRTREDAEEARPFPTPAQSIRIWEVRQGLPPRVVGAVKRHVQASRRKSGRVLQRVPAAPSASGHSRQSASASGVQAPPHCADEDDVSDIDCQAVEEMLYDQSAEMDVDEDERQLDRVTTSSGPSPNKDFIVTEHHPLPSLATSVAQRLAEAGDRVLQENLRGAVSLFLYSVRAEEGAANLRRGREDDPIRLEVERDPEDEARRRFLQALDPVFYAFQASAHQSSQMNAALSATAAVKMEE